MGGISTPSNIGNLALLTAIPKGTYNATAGPGGSVSLANFSGGSVLPFPAAYMVVATVYFGSAVAPVDSTDNDNFFVSVDGVSIGGQLVLPAIQNAPQTLIFPYIYTITGAIAIKTKAAATAGVVYRSILEVLPVSGGTG